MEEAGAREALAAHIVNYADDLVICCRGQAEEALARMRDIMTKLKLTVNETKTRVCKLPEEKFDFLGRARTEQIALRLSLGEENAVFLAS
jgi:RNA-directed DNA polymerase